MDDKKTTQSAGQSPLNPPQVIQLLNAMLALHEARVDGQLVDCETCGAKIDCLAELVAAGHNPDKVLPAIYAHLCCCSECNEEFQALLLVIQATQSGKC